MLEFIEETARRAGAEAMNFFNGLSPNMISGKASTRDLVSTADRAVEKTIISLIRKKYPAHGIFGEESGHTDTGSEYCWVIDPIDGTQSFVKRHPYFSISICLKKKRKAIAGCVYAPALGLLFSAEEGKGAFENGLPIHPSGCTEIGDAACSTGFACLRAQHLEHNNLPYFNRIAPRLRDIKRCGSAALDLAFTASGRYDAYWEFCLAEYDVAAGACIAELAGAKVCDAAGGGDYPARGILAANPVLLEKLLPFFRETGDPETLPTSAI